jgi:hypothetical protein
LQTTSIIVSAPSSNTGERCIGIAQEALNRFLEKNKDYQDDHRELGTRGEFPDINRKFKKLRRATWEGQPLTGETLEELCFDLIGHMMLVIDCARQEQVDLAFD